MLEQLTETENQVLLKALEHGLYSIEDEEMELVPFLLYLEDDDLALKRIVTQSNEKAFQEALKMLEAMLLPPDFAAFAYSGGHQLDGKNLRCVFARGIRGGETVCEIAMAYTRKLLSGKLKKSGEVLVLKVPEAPQPTSGMQRNSVLEGNIRDSYLCGVEIIYGGNPYGDAREPQAILSFQTVETIRKVTLHNCDYSFLFEDSVKQMESISSVKALYNDHEAILVLDPENESLNEVDWENDNFIFRGSGFSF